jgi:Cap4 SAVED domain
MKKLNQRLKHLIVNFSVDDAPPSIHNFHLTYEHGEYRQDDLVKAIYDALPHFALTPSEYEELKNDNDIGEMYRKSWIRISKAKKDKKGDYGEILLFLLLNVFFKAPKFVTKVRLRSSRGEQIKGYDCGHFTVDESNAISLWLGEAKFHQSFSGALSSVKTEIANHTSYSYMKDEMSILSSNVEYNKNSVIKETIESLLDGTIALDSVKIVIPALLTYDCAILKNHSVCNEDFNKAIEEDFENKMAAIDSTIINIPPNVTVKFLLLPLKEVSIIKSKLDAIEKAHQ